VQIVSGGQTGVDRAALEVALELGLACGGWCPRGRRAEDGTIDPRYPLAETPRADYAQRTAWNVRDSDGTLILNLGELRGGSALTLERARRARKPHRCIDLACEPDVVGARAWLIAQRIRVLNVAGPRESEHPGIHAQAVRFLRRLLARRLDG
jgi:hypothetical protein